MTPPQRQRRSPGQPSAPLPASGPAKEGENRNPERLFVIGGDEAGERADIDLVTLIVARAEPPVSATPEQAAVLRLCVAPLSAAELSAYLSLPFSVLTVLLTDCWRRNWCRPAPPSSARRSPTETSSKR